MSLKSGKFLRLAFILFICGWVSMLAGCTQEAKKERHWGRGEKYFAENKFKEAIIEYRNFIKLAPNDPKAYYKLGLSFLRSGQIRDAFPILTKAVELDPEQADARIQLGNLYLLARDPKKAREQAEKALAKEPNNPSGLLLMSSVYLVENNLQAAIGEA